MHNRAGGAAFAVAVISVVLATGGPTAFAQSAIDPPKLPGNQPQVPMLKLVAHPGITNGKVAAIKGTVNGEGLRFAIASLSILQPVVITLLARDPSDDLKLTLFKKDWKEPRRAGSTGANGSVSFSFRTEGGMHVLVQSSGPLRPFTLVGWAGEEIRPSSMKPVIVTPAQFKGDAPPSRDGAGTGAGAAPLRTTTPETLRSSHLGWVVAGGLGLVVVVLGVLVLRRTRK